MSATRIEVLASGAQTATARLPPCAVADVTVASGTLSLFLQAGAGGGSRGTVPPFELALVSGVTVATNGTVTSNNRNIHNQITGTARAYAIYRVLTDLIRPAWVISGSGATFTFSVK